MSTQPAGPGPVAPTGGVGQRRGRWTEEQLRASDGICRLQSGTNQHASQQGETGFGTPRNTTTPVTISNPQVLAPGYRAPTDDGGATTRVGRWTVDQLRATDGVLRLQSGTNTCASQRGMTGFGAPRDVRGKHMHRLWDPNDDSEKPPVEQIDPRFRDFFPSS